LVREERVVPDCPLRAGGSFLAAEGEGSAAVATWFFIAPPW